MDFETRSACELKKAGAYKYSLDPSTQPTCLAIKENGINTIYFLDFKKINTPWKSLPPKFKTLWLNWLWEKDCVFSGHNAFFETCIYKNILVKRYGWPEIPFRKFRCTAAKAAAHALPRALGDAGAALELSIQKDRRGYAAMMATCKPTKRYNAWVKARAEVKAGKRVGKKKLEIAASPAPPKFLEPEADPSTWDTLYTYGKFDVRSEEELDETLPDLMPLEQEIWFFNQRLNWRGIRYDEKLVRKIVAIMEVEEKRHLESLDELTMGLIRKPGAVKSILEFLKNEGVELPNLRAKTVDDQLKEVMNDTAKNLLELRKILSKTSTRKYQSFLARGNDDGRIRDILLYHGASTGRDTGTGVQPHNFPRGLLTQYKGDPYFHVNNVIECDAATLKLLYGEDSLGILFSAILRNMIIPTEGYKLFVGDFSKIEVAVLWWLTGNESGLDILRSGKDPYKYQAAHNLGVAYEDIDDDGDDRQLGKAQVLGNGFGMGWAKFKQTAWDMYRLELTDEQAKAAVASYREANKPVKIGWYAAEKAAVSAIENPGQVYEACRCKFYMRGGFLHFELPSGRTLPHYKPQLVWRDSDYGPKHTIEFWGVNSKTKKWNLERTWGGTIVQNCTQAVARDLMMPAMLRLEKAGYLGLLMVHDEGICESKSGTVEEFQKIMCELPVWGKGLPVESKGWSGERYRK
jgi:DNA polymerase